MDKKSFLKCFPFSDNEYEVAKLYDIYSLALRGAKIYSKSFYTSQYYKKLQEICNKDLIDCSFDGVFDYAERGVICFNDASSNICVIKITCLDKFKVPQHKDYLGSLMAIGIERNKIGDLRVRGKECYIPSFNDIARAIYDNVDRVGNMPVRVEIIDDIKGFDIPPVEFVESIIMIPSKRLDSIVSEITNLSRSKAESLIKQGDVLVNYSIIKEKSHIINEEDILTIRKKGKYIISSEVGFTKSKKIKLSIKKFT